MSEPIKRYGQSFFVSREMAEEYGLVARSREKQAEHDAQVARRRAEREARQPAFYESILALDRMTEQPTRAVLDLHQRVSDGFSWHCEGCDMEGYECEHPRWPCRTVVTVAEQSGLPLADGWEVDRPEDGSLDTPTS